MFENSSDIFIGVTVSTLIYLIGFLAWIAYVKIEDKIEQHRSK